MSFTWFLGNKKSPAAAYMSLFYASIYYFKIILNKSGGLKLFNNLICTVTSKAIIDVLGFNFFHQISV